MPYKYDTLVVRQSYNCEYCSSMVPLQAKICFAQLSLICYEAYVRALCYGKRREKSIEAGEQGSEVMSE